MKNYFMVIVIIMATFAGYKNDKKTASSKSNIFFEEWDTPFEVPPFSKIENKDYLPAFKEGIKQQQREIDAIINNDAEPTFENTVEAFEYSGALLNKVSSVFFNLIECMNSSEMQAIEEEVIPLISQHEDDIVLNAALFQKIKTVYDKKESLNLKQEQNRLLEKIYQNFVRNGANIPEIQQARFRELNEQIARLTSKFGNNVLGATNSYKLIVDDINKLEGLSQNDLDAAAETANKNKETKGKWVFTIQLPSMEPFLQNCNNRELRKELWTAYSSRCTSGEFDNTKIIDSIVNYRLERANILGFPSHAAWKLDNSMAKTPQAATELLLQVWKPALKKAKEEAAEYQNMIIAEGNNFQLEPWDWKYYTEKLRKEKYDLNDDSIRPYFPLSGVKEAMFMVAGKLYDLEFVENKDIPVYFQEVEAFEVKRNNTVIAILYMDFFPRESKRSGAWMTNFREQYVDKNEKNVIPVISLVMNFTKPTADKPSLLNFDQTETMFHEFGHALHGILSKCHYKYLSGTNVSRDFVELPSQFYENFARFSEIMKTYAKNYKTGEAIPDNLMKKIGEAATYGQGFINTELLAASLLDMNLYSITKHQSINIVDFEKKAMTQIGLIKEIIPRYRGTYFQHIFSNGYDAGYYSYTWAAVLDNDAFEAFRENGVYDKPTADKFRINILEKGNTEDNMELYVKFRGKKPSIEPLLKNRGLK